MLRMQLRMQGCRNSPSLSSACKFECCSSVTAAPTRPPDAHKDGLHSEHMRFCLAVTSTLHTLLQLFVFATSQVHEKRHAADDCIDPAPPERDSQAGLVLRCIWTCHGSDKLNSAETSSANSSQDRMTLRAKRH